MANTTPSIGILLTNLGSPDNTSYQAVRRYLKQFLSDFRVIENDSPWWKAILYGFVLTLRPFKTRQSYQKIWDQEHHESPLKLFTRWQAQALQKCFAQEGNVTVTWAMRYGNPSLEEAMEKLKEAGCHHILHMPLYPQYSSPTTATANDHFFRYLMKQRWQPAIRTLPSFPTHPLFIEGIVRMINKSQAKAPHQFERIVISFHGLPKLYIDKGDPYYEECLATSRAITEKMGASKDFMPTTFQSRFGPMEWLQPYTIDKVQELAKEGVKHIAVVMPAFFTDCLETLEEIAYQVHDAFIESGGETLTAIPCLNATPEATKLLNALARQELQGWLNH